IGPEDVGPRSERDGGDLHDPPCVPIADDSYQAEQVLVDRRLFRRLERSGRLEPEVAFALQVVQLAEDLPVELVVDRQVIAPFDGLGKAEVELTQPYVAVDAADLVHGPNHRESRLLD